ncbi:sporulation histidine kinase inhibitor Sda [Domibacillus sp. DTU_2020_1001157_1_SI_ALB_TIR_016]|nr:sporulation histidine kinase inhibitor Sda [Domibacillus sp. DTU_2020_1001157_1_SI_ALB_TIR_016]WNS79243.1 sporulation histidine kinase inhibitor Sda [Domibacillus sp. DTU_2020_1001157_1_SI_ALB_TIR_016]
MKLSHLSDKLLIRAYKQAKKINLDKEFVYMLEKEIYKRNLSTKDEAR